MAKQTGNRTKIRTTQDSRTPTHVSMVELVNVKPTLALRPFWLPPKVLSAVRTDSELQRHAVTVSGRAPGGHVIVEKENRQEITVDAQDLFASMERSRDKIEKVTLGSQDWATGRMYRLTIPLDGFAAVKFSHPNKSLFPKEDDILLLTEVTLEHGSDLWLTFLHNDGKLSVGANLAFGAIDELRAAKTRSECMAPG